MWVGFAFFWASNQEFWLGLRMSPRSSPPSHRLKIGRNSFHGLCPKPRLHFPVQSHGFERCRGSNKFYGVWVAQTFAPSAPHQYSRPGKHMTLPPAFQSSDFQSRNDQPHKEIHRPYEMFPLVLQLSRKHHQYQRCLVSGFSL